MMSQEELQTHWILRKVLAEMDDLQATDFLINRLSATKTNNEFFDAMKRS
jgi:transcription termination factor Rho